jgi:eukaryotic-like serine/threonine-protein kinase
MKGHRMRRAEPPDLGALSASQAEWVSRTCDEFEADWERARRPAVREFMQRPGNGADLLVRRVLLRELLTAELELRERDLKGRDIDAHRASFDRPGESEVVEFVLGEQAKADASRRFRAIELHASGGLGEVFVARDEQLGRRVALKRIKPEMAEDEGSRNRFVDEAEVTSQLEHPNIAPVYALGLDHENLPFYAMRFVEGEPLEVSISRFHQARTPRSDQGERLLSLRKFLGNLIAVCNAAAFAHSRGIVHRDIKPSNVILGRFGETFLVDWGLAKRLASPSTDSTVGRTDEPERGGDRLTDHGSVLGTLPYMSPEQAETATGGTSAASDVYSLGATLYHMLTGRVPFVGKDREELRRKVIQGDFPPPREVDPRIAPALDAIVCKAMARDPNERYVSATALAEDLEHWLADEPVTARREPLAIRAGRWARRHRTWVVSAGAGLFVAAVAFVTSTVALAGKNRELENQRRQVTDQRDRAESSAEIAEAVNDFVNRDLLAQAAVQIQAEPGSAPNPNLTVKEALNRAAARIGERFARRPIVEASIRQTIGEAYFHLGRHPNAREHLEHARALRARELGENHPDTLKTLVVIGGVLLEDGNLLESETVLMRAMNGLSATLSAEDPRTLFAKHGVAKLYATQGKLYEAEQLLQTLRDAYQLTKEGAGPEALDVANSLAIVYEAQRKFEPAKRLLLEAIEASAHQVGARHPITLTVKSNLAMVYNSLGIKTEGERLRKEVLAGRRSVLSNRHPETLYSMAVLGDYYRSEGRLDEAEPLLREAVEEGRTALDQNNDVRMLALVSLAVVYSSNRDLEKLEPVLKETADVALSKYGPDHNYTAKANVRLASLYLDKKDYPRAEPYFRDYRIHLLKTAPDGWDRLVVESRLGGCLLEQKKYVDAEPRLLSACDGMKAREKSASGEKRREMRNAFERIVRLYRELGQKDKSAEWTNRFDDVVFPADAFVPR